MHLTYENTCCNMKTFILITTLLMNIFAVNAQESNLELLQGKWQSMDDKTNFLVFEDNHRKEIAKGMTGWDDEEFTLSDKCINDNNKESENEREKDRYISCKESDLCWYIIEVTPAKLSLSYVSRGNTLTYKKVKQ